MRSSDLRLRTLCRLEHADVDLSVWPFTASRRGTARLLHQRQPTTGRRQRAVVLATLRADARIEACIGTDETETPEVDHGATRPGQIRCCGRRLRKWHGHRRSCRRALPVVHRAQQRHKSMPNRRIIVHDVDLGLRICQFGRSSVRNGRRPGAVGRNETTISTPHSLGFSLGSGGT